MRKQHYKTYQVHRIIGLLFIEKPERHQNKDFGELEINHKDAIKTNNFYKNLEWVTGEENMKHAWSMGLIKTEKTILTRNVFNGEINYYRSISECARQHLISTSALSNHLLSPVAGRIIQNNLVFKLDNNLEWPIDIFEERDNLYIGRVCDVVGENIITKEKIIFLSLKEATHMLNFPKNALMLHRQRKGHNVPYNDWIFYRLSDYINKGEYHNTIS